MHERQASLLANIIEQYIATAQPVGSKAIVDQGVFDVSSATIRNEMAALESEGYIYQPHTSSGRVPTERGYHYYVAHQLEVGALPKKQQAQLKQHLDDFSLDRFKLLIKDVATLSDNAVFVTFAANSFYYTGFSNLFAQPEFGQRDLVCRIGDMIDHFDQIVADLNMQVSGSVDILIGSKNPFSQLCSAVIGRYSVADMDGIIGILGPTRMDYRHALSSLSFIQKQLQS